MKCDRYDECLARHNDLVRRVDGIDDRLRQHGETIAALRAQVTMWAALGALAGGGIVTVVANLLMKH